MGGSGNPAYNHRRFLLSLTYPGTSLWGPKKVTSLKYSAMTVLPIFVHALRTGHPLVLHEVALQMESLVVRQVPVPILKKNH